MIRPDLSIRRLLPIWAPLALTFLLISGSTPVVNASINRLPTATRLEDLAAFGVLLRLVIFLHSPLFVVREIVIKLTVDRAGWRRAFVFCVATGIVMAGIELVLALTPLGRAVLDKLTNEPELAARAHRALLAVSPVPVLIAVRGFYQAQQIRVDDTLFVGLGTLARLIFVAVFGLHIAPALGIEGTVMGGLALSLGLAVETLWAVLRARTLARPPERAPAGTRRLGLAGFALPLMFANMLSVTPQLLYLKIAGRVQDPDVSLAALQEAVSLQWLFTSSTLALSALATAKVHRPGDGKAMLRFGLVVGMALSVLLVLVVFTPLRSWFLTSVLGQRNADVREAVRVALMLGAWMPLLMAVRFTLRGVLIARGLSKPISVAMVSSLLLLSLSLVFELPPHTANGAFNAYVWWNAALLLELGILARAAVRSGRPGGGLPPPPKTPAEMAGG